jgi:hypothetical protein
MTEKGHRQLVADLARKTLEQIDPDSEELKLFNIYSEDYFRSPKKALEGMKVKETPVGGGFGVGEAILIYILLWLGQKVADKAIDRLLDRGFDFIEKDLSQAQPSNPALRLLKQLLQKLGLWTVKSTPLDLSTLPPLTIIQQQQVREETLADPDVKALALEYQISDIQIVRWVDATVANLPVKPNQPL